MSRENEGVRELIFHIGPKNFKRFYLLSELTCFINFFSFETFVTFVTFKISHNTKSKICRHLCDVILPAKNVKMGKIEIMNFYRMTNSILLRKFRLMVSKLNILIEI